MRLITVLLLSTGLMLAACSGGDGGGRAPEAGDRAVAKVEGETIWASDVRREAVAKGLILQGEALDVSSDLFRRVLDEVIDQKLLGREAERRGLDRGPLAERRLAAVKERILSDMLVETVVDGAISEDAIKRLYEDQLQLARVTEEIRLRLILSRTEAEARAVIGILNQGAAFEAVAAQSSIDESTRFSGGDLGYRTTDVLPQAYVTALGSAPAGSTVGPFQTDGGWAVLRVEDRRREAPPTLEQARPLIVRYLTYDKVRQLLEDLRGKAKVEVLLNNDPLAVPGAPQEPASAPAGTSAPAATPAPAVPPVATPKSGATPS